MSDGSDLDSVLSDSSLPEVAEILARSSSSHRKQESPKRSPEPSTSSSNMISTSESTSLTSLTESATPKSEPIVAEQLPETPAKLSPQTPAKPPPCSPLKTRSSSRKSKQTTASASTPSATSSGTSGRTRSSRKTENDASTSRPASSSGGKRKRGHDVMEGSSQFPEGGRPLTQPSKRARRATQLPAPPASQPPPRPVPVTPSQRPSSSAASLAIPPSTRKDKGKQKAVIRQRSTNFWHLDGSVVVQVRNTLFRLHRSRLAQQSEYFGALFREDENAIAAEEKDVVDSCPVYVAKGVSVLDFERLLAALDAGVAYAIKPPPFPVLASLLRAAHALQFDNIFSFATHLLREMWPQDIARIPDEPRPYALETVLVAQQCDVPEVLKPAYYDLLRKPTFGQDLTVYVHAESSNAFSALDIATAEDEANAPRARLAASDMVRLLSAKEALAKEWFALMCAAPLPSAFPCPNAAHANDNGVRIDRQKEAQDCAKARKADGTQWTARLMQSGVFEVGMRDVLLGLERLAEVDWQGVGYCVGCVGERRLAWSDMRERLWKRLDVLLGLKGEDEE